MEGVCGRGELRRMRVVLRNTRLGLYYAGAAHWVSGPEEAQDFQDVEHAREFAGQAKGGELQVFLHYNGGTRAYRAGGHHTVGRRN